MPHRTHVRVPSSCVRTGALVAAALLVLGACGGGEEPTTGTGATDPAEGEEQTALSDADRSSLQDLLDRYGTELIDEYGAIGVGGMAYSAFDGYVEGTVDEAIIAAVEKCQLYADAIGELDGPPGTVPVRIVSYEEGGEPEVLAEGIAGGTCAAG